MPYSLLPVDNPDNFYPSTDNFLLSCRYFKCPFYASLFYVFLFLFYLYQVETSGLYNHDEDENFMQDDDVDDDTTLNTRGLVTEHNKKKRKSGGFQSMGTVFLTNPNNSWSINQNADTSNHSHLNTWGILFH